MRTTRVRWLLAVLAGMLVLGACGGGNNKNASASGTTETTSKVRGDITVYAAASLTKAFGDMKAAFEKAYPGTSVKLNFGGSQALREQILSGAPGDVFASANTSNMDQVVKAGKASDPQTFATNKLEIAVPPNNPGKVTGLDAFGMENLKIGLCAEEVPCGQFGRQALQKAGVTPKPDTNEPDVRALLTKVQAGDLDAGLVYKTDVKAAGAGVKGIAIPDDLNVVATYPIARLTGSGNVDVAQAWVDFVVSPKGQKILKKRGFTEATT
jgi:molybdate transport system substrate-binding protein